VAKGQLVPVAVPGARLGDRLYHRKAEAERHRIAWHALFGKGSLGLSDDRKRHFCPFLKMFRSGEELGNVLEINDHVLDVNVPSEQGRLFVHTRHSQEVACITASTLTLPLHPTSKRRDMDALSDLTRDKGTRAPGIVLRIIRDGSLLCGLSYWMRSRITKCGMRPITPSSMSLNYIMLNSGRPLHAFDYERIIGSKKIEVRLRRIGRFRTLGRCR